MNTTSLPKKHRINGRSVTTANTKSFKHKAPPGISPLPSPPPSPRLNSNNIEEYLSQQLQSSFAPSQDNQHSDNNYMSDKPSSLTSKSTDKPSTRKAIVPNISTNSKSFISPGKKREEMPKYMAAMMRKSPYAKRQIYVKPASANRNLNQQRKNTAKGHIY